MKPASPQLQALLASRQFYSADLYTFQLISGSTLRYCGGDTSIKANGFTYLAAPPDQGPIFVRPDNRALCTWSLGIEVSSLVFDVLPASATVIGQPFMQAIKNGIFDGATMTLERAFMPLYGDTARGTVILFVGRVAEVDGSRSVATFTVNSHTELFNQNMPRNICQAGCVNTLFDASCTLNPASFAVSGTVAAGSTLSNINATLAQPTGYFDLGKIVFNSGTNGGNAYSVKTYTNGSPSVISLLRPLTSAPAAGDTFTIYPGCDKTTSTCSAKFSNLANFRGTPFVPLVETAI